MRRLRLSTTICLVCTVVIASGPFLYADFLRGDANRDDRVTVADAVSIILSLFSGGPELPCRDAADANDDGNLDTADIVTTLAALFRDGDLPSPGAIRPGPDLTCDALECADGIVPTPAIVLSEIQYNPNTRNEREFVELHNRTDQEIDVSGYAFTNGIAYVVPEGTTIAAGGYLLVAKDPAEFERLTDVKVIGPYEGQLSDSGERLTLSDGDCEVESVRYDDRAPWPTGADGTRRSLERINYETLADDFHSWRTAETFRNDTPGSENSSFGIPTHPVINAALTSPRQPSSQDTITVSIDLDVVPARIKEVLLRWEVVTTQVSELQTVVMAMEALGDASTQATAQLPPQASQSLVRYDLEVTLDDDTVLQLPHEAEPFPFKSIFVYDFEIPHALPILWMFARKPTNLRPRLVPSGAVVLETGSQEPLVFGDALSRDSGNGQKLKFAKGNEYREDRTLNIIPRLSRFGSPISAHVEGLGFVLFRSFGALSPRAEWVRLIDFHNTETQHGRALVVQQVNERFFAMNGLDPDGDIYKLDKVMLKQNNIGSGSQRQVDLVGQLRSSDLTARRTAIDNNLDIENVLQYSAISMMMANWDGYHNNHFLYDGLTPESRWKLIPWDLDQVFLPCCIDMPVSWPKNGNPIPGAVFQTERPAGLMLAAVHSFADLDDAYRAFLRAEMQPGGRFTVEAVNALIEPIEQSLLSDLSLHESFAGTTFDQERTDITGGYASIRSFVESRVSYLLSVLEDSSGE